MAHIMLSEPVALGDVRLAPTTELAGLAELQLLADHEQRLAALLRIAHAIRREDNERARIALMRATPGTTPLPRRLPRRLPQRHG
jgi:hypothetical protein